LEVSGLGSIRLSVELPTLNRCGVCATSRKDCDLIGDITAAPERIYGGDVFSKTIAAADGEC
jgi:hypothetical protein